MEVQAKYGIQQTIYFPLIDAGTQNFATGSDYTFAAGDCKIIKDGGTAANSTNSVTDETTGLWSLTLTAAELQATRIAVLVVDSATKAIEDQCIIVNTTFSGQLEASAGIIIGEVETATTAATTTTMEALTISPNTTEEATADHFNGRLILFTSGALLGQMTDITDYALANSNMSLTFTALTEAPADTDRFVIL